MEKIKKDVNEQENRAIQELENDSTKEKESEVSEKKVRKSGSNTRREDRRK